MLRETTSYRCLLWSDAVDGRIRTRPTYSGSQCFGRSQQAAPSLCGTRLAHRRTQLAAKCVEYSDTAQDESSPTVSGIPGSWPGGATIVTDERYSQ